MVWIPMGEHSDKLLPGTFGAHTTSNGHVYKKTYNTYRTTDSERFARPVALPVARQSVERKAT